MITIFVDNCNPLSQTLYDKTLNDLQFHQLSCNCGHSGVLSIHGYYNRGVKSEGVLTKLRICRVKCSVCDATHALLLSLIVPYSQVTLADQISIISCYENHSDFTSIMEKNPAIDENNIHYIIRQYQLHWLQRILSETMNISMGHFFLNQCFSLFKRQFMQIHRTINIPFLKPT